MKIPIYSKILIIIFLVSLGLCLHFIPKKIKEHKHNERKSEIKQFTENLLGNCTSESFEERRTCFQSKLQDLRKSNQMVKIKYQLIYNEKTTELASEDLGDLVKITKDQNLSFFSCLSNTFLVHWDLNYIYLSLENPFGILICKDGVGNDIVIAPSDLSESNLNQIIKSLKETQIK